MSTEPRTMGLTIRGLLQFVETADSPGVLPGLGDGLSAHAEVTFIERVVARAVPGTGRDFRASVPDARAREIAGGAMVTAPSSPSGEMQR